MATLEAIVTIAARRIDAIRVTQERHEREIREREMGRLATEAELRALRAQINPHFLFNALTTIGYLIQTAPPRALQTLLRLTSLLRGVLRVGRGVHDARPRARVIEAYLDIERARFEQRLRVHDRRAARAAPHPPAGARPAAARRERGQARRRAARSGRRRRHRARVSTPGCRGTPARS